MSGSSCDLYLSLFDCRGLRASADVADVMVKVHQAGLLPAEGAWTHTTHPTPVTDLVAFAAARRTIYNLPPHPDRLRMSEGWACALLRSDQPMDKSSLSLANLYPGIWHLEISAVMLPTEDQPLDVFCAEWGALLERVGTVLFDRIQPAVAWLIAIPSDEFGPDLVEAADRRRLIVGWRTWYGPAYVEAFGRDWLLGLPDRAAPLPDGGVAHGLDAPLAALVRGEPAPYAAVRAYLRRAGIRPAWPEPA
jgi:hypothetical protein